MSRRLVSILCFWLSIVVKTCTNLEDCNCSVIECWHLNIKVLISDFVSDILRSRVQQWEIHRLSVKHWIRLMSSDGQIMTSIKANEHNLPSLENDCFNCYQGLLMVFILRPRSSFVSVPISLISETMLLWMALNCVEKHSSSQPWE